MKNNGRMTFQTVYQFFVEAQNEQNPKKCINYYRKILYYNIYVCVYTLCQLKNMVSILKNNLKRNDGHLS